MKQEVRVANISDERHSKQKGGVVRNLNLDHKVGIIRKRLATSLCPPASRFPPTGEPSPAEVCIENLALTIICPVSQHVFFLIPWKLHFHLPYPFFSTPILSLPHVSRSHTEHRLGDFFFTPHCISDIRCHRSRTMRGQQFVLLMDKAAKWPSAGSLPAGKRDCGPVGVCLGRHGSPTRWYQMKFPFGRR